MWLENSGCCGKTHLEDAIEEVWSKEQKEDTFQHINPMPFVGSPVTAGGLTTQVKRCYASRNRAISYPALVVTQFMWGREEHHYSLWSTWNLQKTSATEATSKVCGVGLSHHCPAKDLITHHWRLPSTLSKGLYFIIYSYYLLICSQRL